MSIWHFVMCFIRNILYIQLFVGGLMSCLRFLCLFAWVVSNTYRVVLLFCLSLLCVLCTLCCQLLWIVHSWCPLRFSLTFIYTKIQTEVDSHTSQHQMRYHNNNKWLGQTKDYQCCFSAKHWHEGVIAKTCWLRIRIMCPRVAICLPTEWCFNVLVTIKLKLKVLVWYKGDNIVISSNVIYSRHDILVDEKFHILALSNNHSITHYPKQKPWQLIQMRANEQLIRL